MAVTTSIKESIVMGSKRVIFGTVTLSNSYPTGGEAVTASLFGLSAVSWLIPIYPGADYVQSTNKLRMRSTDAHHHPLTFAGGGSTNAVTMAANVLASAAGGALSVVGGGASGVIVSATANNVPSASGPFEVANTTDLSSITMSFIAIGV